MPLIALIVGVSILLMNEREYLKEGIKMTRKEGIKAKEVVKNYCQEKNECRGCQI